MNNNIKKCFDIENLNKYPYLKQYLSIIDKNIKNPTNDVYFDKHHIIPKSWFKLNNVKLDSSKHNIIKMNIRDHLMVHVLLLYHYIDVKDIDMYQGMVHELHNMLKISEVKVSEFLRLNNNFPKWVYDDYYRMRVEYHKKDRKYSQDYIEKCFDIYSQFDDMNEGFQAVKKQMDFPYDDRRVLQVQFMKYINRDRYNNTIKRQMRWFYGNKDR